MTHTSREYAEALYELAAEEGKTEAYAAALDTVEAALAESPGFLNLLASPAISREERMDALSAAFQERIPLSMLVLLRMMVYRGHARSLPQMMESFRDLAREHRGETVAKVTSAVALTDAEQAALRAKLEQRFGKKMNLECSVDAALLGGLRVETEGRVLDGTLRTRLQEIKEVMDS
ncbi:MAG: ATP synthase F1 subunit delta [Clostridia bacterium]|nr:ATP synthase F1 subunit delta [Clostridia bacterium]